MKKKLAIAGLIITGLVGLAWTGWSMWNYFAWHYTAVRDAAPAMRLELHNFDPELPLADRIAVVPSDVVRTLWSVGVQPYTILPEVKAKIVRALDAIMTPELEAFLKERLVGIAGAYTSDFYGLMMPIMGADGTPYFHMTLNLPSVEGLPSPSSSPGMFATVDESIHHRMLIRDNLEDLLEYVLLLEIGHGVDFVFGITDLYPTTGLKSLDAGPASSFGDDVWATPWTPHNGLLVNERWDSYNPDFKPFPNTELSRFFAAYKANPLVTFYASSNQAEDWAETWAHWHWVKRLGKEYIYQLTVGENPPELVRFYDNPGAQARMETAGRFFQNEFQAFLAR